MNAHTHLIGGAVVGAAFLPLAGPHALAFLAAAILSAPLPDIDHPGSLYGRFVPLPGVARIYGKVEAYRPGPFGNGNRSFGHVGRWTPFGILWHRGPVHSVLAACLSAAVAASVVDRLLPGASVSIGLGVLAGYLSHLLLDECNVSGMRLFWPLSEKDIKIPWPSFRVGSIWESIFAMGMLAVLVGLIHLYGGIAELLPLHFGASSFIKGK